MNGAGVLPLYNRGFAVHGMRRFAALILLLSLGSVPSRAEDQSKEGKVDFSRDISPILANNCLLCHGPDAKGRKGDLRLDVREGALLAHEGKAAIVPGKPDQSELIRRVTTTDREEVMPPAKSGKKLTKAQIDVLRRWVE